MHDVAWRGKWICVRSKDAQKQLAWTSLNALVFCKYDVTALIVLFLMVALRENVNIKEILQLHLLFLLEFNIVSKNQRNSDHGRKIHVAQTWRF